MLFSVMSGRIRISRAARVIGASSAGPADSVGGLLSARVASFRQRLLERLEPGALAHHPSGAPGSRRSSRDRKSTRLNSSHLVISYAVFCLKKKKKKNRTLIAHKRL